MKKILLVILAFLLFGCSGTKEGNVQETEQSLTFVMASDPKNMDPGLNSEAVAGALINNLFEGLMRELNGELTPGIALEYTLSPDKTTYTFKLKETNWSDGTPLTAKDFKYSWIRAMAPETASTYAALFFPIQNAEEFYNGETDAERVGITVVDDYTLTVELDAPTPYFLELTSFYTFLPVKQEIVESYGETWAQDPKSFISNGPFKLEKYEIGSEFVLVKNENYWNAESVSLDRIEAPIITDESTALTAFEGGEVDIISTLPAQELVRLSTESDEFYVIPGVGTYFYVFNNSKFPTNDLNVRKALTFAVDKVALTENVTRGQEIPATSYVPPTNAIKNSKGQIFADETTWEVPPSGDVEQAREYLAAAGFPNGEGFPELELLYNTSENHKAIAEAIQAMWKENLNIDVKLTNQEWSVFLNTRGKGEFDGVARFGWSIDYPDALSMFEIFSSFSGSNSAQWISPEFNRTLQAIRLESDGNTRDQLLHKAENMLLDGYVLLPLYYYTTKFMVHSNVKGWERASLGFWYFGDIYLESE